MSFLGNAVDYKVFVLSFAYSSGVLVVLGITRLFFYFIRTRKILLRLKKINLFCEK